MEDKSIYAEEEKSILTNLIPVLILTSALMLALTAGLITAGTFAIAVYIFPILYFVFYFITQANKFPFPMYFFIAMAFVIGNAATVSSEMIFTVIQIQAGILAAVVIINISMSVRKRLPFMPRSGIENNIKHKYYAMLTSDPQMPIRITMHCMILYIAGFTAYLLQEYRGKWVLLACGAILIGDQLPVLTKRGINFMIGAFLACTIASFIGYYHVPVSVRVWFYIPAFVGVFYFMPKVANKPNFYIAGSMLVAIMAMIGNSLSQDIITRDIVLERFLCGLLGLGITLISCHLINFICKGIYQAD